MPKNHLIRTTIQLTASSYEQLRELAYKQRRSIASIIREAVEQWLKKK